MFSVYIPYETPSKKNSRVVDRRTGRTFPNKIYTEWHRMAAIWLKATYDLPRLEKRPYSVYMGFCHGDRRRRDSDNGVSSIFDLLVDLHVLPDDCWEVVRKISVENIYDKGKPGVEISIIPLTNAEKLSRL